MSLLVTSCTMGKQPDRLLNKGPEYLRTRTNAGLFGQHRKSAVELLAASKAQFYSIRPSVSLDNYQDLAVSRGQHERYGQISHGNKPKVPPRSKSQYDLSIIHLSTADDENDDKNYVSSDDSLSTSEVNASSTADSKSGGCDAGVQKVNSNRATRPRSFANFLHNPDSAQDLVSFAASSAKGLVEASTPQPGLIDLRSQSTTLSEHERIYENITLNEYVYENTTLHGHIYENITLESKSEVASVVIDGVKKPIPLPRKFKDKPVPPPRKLSVKSPHDELNITHSGVRDITSPPVAHLCVHDITSPPVVHLGVRDIITSPGAHLDVHDITSPPVAVHTSLLSTKHHSQETPRKLSINTLLDEKVTDSHVCLSEAVSLPLASPVSLQNKCLIRETPTVKTLTSKDSKSGTRTKHSLVESLTKRFTALSATSKPIRPEIHSHIRKEDKSTELQDTSGITGTFTATPVYISRAGATSQSLQVKQVFICGDQVDSCEAAAADKETETRDVSRDHIVCSKGRKRCPDATASNSVVKKERRTIASETSCSKPGFVNSLVTRFSPVRKSSSTSTSRSEMSIESVDQAVCESDLKAIPTASMETDSLRGPDEQAREVTRSNSSLSGKMDSQDLVPITLTPTPHCALVPRSHSDIGCCLESQHSRDSSLVSSHSRLSRASVGADLESFFNQMGLEKGVLEPVGRLRELQASEVFDSISSLDSHDAASICSTYSRSEQEWNDSQSVDRSQQQTSIVERNARIIKWLCNVRKAKGQQPQKLESAAASKT